jgi:hypothetical protein
MSSRTPKLQLRRGASSPAAGVAAAAPQPRLQLPQIERFDQVVVSPYIEPVDPIGDRVARGQDQHRHPVAQLAQPPADLQTVDPRHPHIQHHRVRHPLRDQPQRLRPTLRRLHLVPGQRQRPTQRIAQSAVVVDHQDPHRTIVTQTGKAICRPPR